MSLAQPFLQIGPLGTFRDYPVFVLPKPKLHLPSSLDALKLDLTRLWLTRSPRKLKPKQLDASWTELKARTPVFTPPPPEEPTSPVFPLGHSPVLPPIKLPQLLPFKLCLDEADETYDWEDFSDIDTASSGSRERRGDHACDVGYMSPLLPSPPRRYAVRPSETVGKLEWTEFGGCFNNLEDSDSSDDEDMFWPRSFSFDDAYLGDTEDNCSDSEDEDPPPTRPTSGPKEVVDCFAWLDAELECLFTGLDENVSQED